MLYPINNSKRTVINLNGIWKFLKVADDYLPREALEEYELISVPSSYNELFTDKETRDYVGKVCYETLFSIPEQLRDEEVRIRIGSAAHRSVIYLNGEKIGDHNGGFLPIDLKVPNKFTEQDAIRMSIILDNRLDFQTLPIGEVIEKSGVRKQSINHDFANQTGIHRDVLLYTRPQNHIEDIVIKTKEIESKAIVSYQVKTNDKIVSCTILDKEGSILATSTTRDGEIKIENPHLWDIGDGYLYVLEVKTKSDIYQERFGIRTFEIVDQQLMLNHRPIYLKGFGMHEDHLIIGKGNNTANNIRDFNLLKWINANSFRTSHYPYAEEIYRLADEMGILVINEVPAVGLNFWSERPVFTEGTVDEKTLEVHKKQLKELLDRDKNHPCIIMYSLANEANTNEANSVPYFEALFGYFKKQTELPLMIVEWVSAENNKVAQLADIIGLNRYIGWYSSFSELEEIENNLKNDLEKYYKKFNKPILMTEFGADTIAGLHQLPSVAFSEEFQIEFIEKYLNVFRTLPFIVGEHVWNFADFMTKQGLTRFHGNKKGIFTRDRQPKMAAYFLKKVWAEKK